MTHHIKRGPLTHRTGQAGILVTCLAFFTLALSASGAQAAKIVTDTFIPPPPGSAGEGNPHPSGIAVNDSSTVDPDDGNVYVSDRNRVAVFDSTFSFVRTFGWDVLRPGAAGNIPNNEEQVLTVTAAAGTYQLGGSELPYDASAGEVEAAINGLPAISGAGGSVSVSGANPFIIEFDGGSLADRNVGSLSVSSASSLREPHSLVSAVGQTLTCEVTADVPLSRSYQWLRSGQAISGATNRIYTPVAADAGEPLQCQAVGRQSSGLAPLRLSRPVVVEPLDGGGLPIPASSPIIGGVPEVGEDLQCEPREWEGEPTFSFQWYRNGEPLDGNGANSATYTVQPEDVEEPAVLQCVVTAANPGGSVRVATVPIQVIQSPPPLVALPLSNISVGIGGLVSLNTLDEGASFEVCAVELDCKTGAASAGGGAIDGSGSIAVDQSDGAVYVGDAFNRRIDKFDAEGNFLWAAGSEVNADGAPDPDVCFAGDTCQAGANDGGEASFNDIGGIAVNPADGNVYVVDNSNDRIQVLAPNGDFAFMWGLDVGGGGEVETCTSGCQPGEGTEAVGGFQNPRDIAVGDQDDVYVVEGHVTNNQSKLAQVFDDPESDPQAAQLFGDGYFTLRHNDPETGETVRADSPSWLAIDSGPTSAANDDVLYVVNGPSYTGSTGTGPPDVVLEFNASAETVQDTHGAGEELDSGRGIVYDPDHGIAGDRLLHAGGLSTSSSRDTVVILEDAAPPDPPEATIEPVTVFDQTTATFEGTVDPNDNPTSYRFEYIDDTAYQANGETFEGASRVPSEADAPVGDGDAPVAVAEEALDLSPGTTYHVRLTARVTGGPNNGTDVSSEAVSFATDPAQPTASTAPVSAKSTAATLAAVVDPRGEETTYRFQYGSQGPCSANPCAETAPQSAGSSGEKLLTHQLSGLDSNTTYHYRLLAESELGEASTPDRSLITIPQDRMPENRAWEQVTPTDKGNTELGTNERQAAASGDGLAFNPVTGTSFPGSEASPGFDNPYLSTRNADGSWSTKALAPPLGPHPFGEGYKVFGYSEDLSRQLVWLRDASGVPGDGDGGYVRDNLSDTFTEIPALAHEGSSPSLRNWVWDPQMEHVAFKAFEPVSPATPQPPAPNSGGFVDYLHRWSEGGGGELISRLPGGEIVPDGSGGIPDHRVSEDGTRIFWKSSTDLDAGSPLYAYDGGQVVEISASERGEADPAGPGSARFQDATGDGELVFFTSEEKLTDDSTASQAAGSAELYRYDFSAPEGERLTDLTPAPAAPNGAEVNGVQGLVDISDSGDRAYFVARAKLAAGAVQGRPNVYLWEEGGGTPAIVHVATLDPDSEVDDEVAARTRREFDRTPMASADGRRFVFRSVERLTSSPTGGEAQVYLFDASTGELECVSCPPSGAAPSGEGLLGTPNSPGTFIDQGLAAHQLRYLSADGRRVFFQTATPLLDADTNGKVDVYEWRDGQLHLISSGQFHQDSTFIDASEDGDSVFFATREALVPTDTDSVMDAYVARVDGVTPQAPVEPPACEGESCSPLPVAPDDPTPSSSTFRGPGNLTEEATRRPRCGQVARSARKQSRRAKRLRRAAKRVRAPRKSRSLRRRATRNAKRAKRLSTKSKRCRRRAARASGQRANANRGAQR